MTNDTNSKDGGDAAAIALEALVWTLRDEARAARLLALTGLDADALRAGVTDPAVLAALIGFLEAHEPDLIACSEAIGRGPADIVAARGRLEA